MQHLIKAQNEWTLQKKQKVARHHKPGRHDYIIIYQKCVIHGLTCFI